MDSSIPTHFLSLEDPRINRNKKHELLDIIMLVICAMCSGANGWEAIEEFGHEKLKWLQKYVPLKNGVPSHDCINYVIARLSAENFRRCFMSWTTSVMESCEGEIIALDGKTARGSRDRKNNKSPLHMVSAWACEQRLVLGQVAIDDKSNEITAIPKLLKLLEIKECIVTIDAMGCQREITKQIIDQEGDYVIGLKGNQGNLHEAVDDFFTVAADKGFNGVVHDYTQEIEKDHGRLEVRRYWVTDELITLPNTAGWSGLRSIGMVERECTTAGVCMTDRRYFIGSIKPDAKLFAKAVRQHWGVENPLHWRLDVILGDDASRVKKDNGAAVLTSLRHLCMNLFEREGSKLSLAKKQRKAGWSDKFREKVVFQ